MRNRRRSGDREVMHRFVVAFSKTNSAVAEVAVAVLAMMISCKDGKDAE